ncbi:MAG: hypothetical protein Q9219_000977 [cf. Caloplaca sp. 3 TL-2023]
MNKKLRRSTNQDGSHTKNKDEAQNKGNNAEQSRIRDLDQVHADLRSSKHLAEHKTAKPAEDLPGLGQFYCVECAKWFESEHSMLQHRRGKNHKRR